MVTQAGVAERFVWGSIDGRPTTALVGRVLLSGIFIVSGIAKLTDTTGTVGYMSSEGIPAPEALAIVAGLAELIGGLAIVFGVLTRLAGIGLIVVLAIINVVFHDFWTLTGPERQMQMVSFVKNVAILGGLVLLVSYGPGRYSVDARLRRQRPTMTADQAPRVGH